MRKTRLYYLFVLLASPLIVIMVGTSRLPILLSYCLVLLMTSFLVIAGYFLGSRTSSDIYESSNLSNLLHLKKEK